MSGESDESATQAPTEKRKQEARRKGDQPRSRDLAALLTTSSGVAALALGGGAAVGNLGTMMAGRLGSDLADPERVEVSGLLLLLGPLVVLLLAPMAGAIVAMAAGGPPTLSLVAPRFSRLNPLAGLARLFGTKGLIETGASLLKIMILGGVAWWFVIGEVAEVAQLARLPFEQAVRAATGVLLRLLLHLCGGLVIIAGWDVPLRIWQWLGRVKMTLQQVRDEARESDGAPELKGAQRRRMRAILNSSARSALKDATVVLVNPTHFAVALRYRPGLDQAPIVVAKGRGATALALRDMADSRSIPVLSQPTLARALYFTARAGQAVHSDLYVAVATVIAWVLNVRASVEADLRPVSVPATMMFDTNGQAISA